MAMSKDQGKSPAQPEQKQTTAVTDKEQVKSTELTDADLDRVSGGAGDKKKKDEKKDEKKPE
jgi:hypothetical protein